MCMFAGPGREAEFLKHSSWNWAKRTRLDVLGMCASCVLRYLEPCPGVFGDSRNERWLSEARNARTHGQRHMGDVHFAFLESSLCSEGEVGRSDKANGKRLECLGYKGAFHGRRCVAVAKVTFPVGDWFLGVGDGGIGRDKVCVQIAGSKLVGPCGMHPFRGQSCRGRADHERPGSRRVFGAPPSPGSGSGSLSDFDENDRPPQAAEIREIRMTHQSPCHRETLCHRVTPCHPLLRPVGDHDLRHARPGPRLEPCASRILAPCRSSTVRLVRMKLHSWEKASGCAVSAVWSCAAAWGDFRRHHGVEEFWTPHSVRFSCR